MKAAAPLLALALATPALAQTPPTAPSAATAPVSYPEIASGDPDTPAIHGPRIVGTTPSRPFLFKIPATGKGTLTFSADGLPPGLALDPATGIITGTVKEAGETAVTLHASGEAGKASRKLTIVAGAHKLALTPPMGWNSWNVWAGAVSQEKVLAAADAMVKSGLAAKGYTYVNIDDCWEGKARDPKTGEITTNERFPDMKALADAVHARGLKLGIYSSPGPRTCGQYLGSYEHEEQDAKTWAGWGVDYVKYDWCTYNQVHDKERADALLALLAPDDAKAVTALREERAPLRWKGRRTPEENAKLKEIDAKIDAILKKVPDDKRKQIDLDGLQKPYKVMRKALDAVDRDIVFSLCQYGMGNVSSWGGSPGVGGNLWRTTGDITDTWGSMAGIGFGQDALSKFAKPGQWNDPDMLVVGKVGWGPKLHPTRLTPHEQLTHITLWSMLAAPLLIGCDMADMDKFTTDLLTNTEVVDVDQDRLGKQAVRVKRDRETEAWARPLFDGTVAVALFNRGGAPATVKVAWQDLEQQQPGNSLHLNVYPVRDLWKRKDLGDHTDGYAATVEPHGAVLIKVGKPAAE